MLRMITGHFKGRKIEAPSASITRPTTDRVRESMFNLLEVDLANEGKSFDGMLVLDAFAGSGALGLEALSRGASHVTFFEQNPKAFGILRQNALHLGCSLKNTKLQRLDALRPPKQASSMDLVFLDPPYGKRLIKFSTEYLAQKGWIDEKALIVAEMAEDDVISIKLEPFIKVNRIYGNTRVCLIQGVHKNIFF